jgi:tetratricopeptide (TPR) repeat protein
MSANKSVFISYRRDNTLAALAVYQQLVNLGYDVFYDIDNIPAGDWKQIILENIKARSHFVVILTPTAVERFHNADDIMRLEIETAIEHKRNIIPLFFEGFSFSSVERYLVGQLSVLPRYNGLEVPMRFFKYAMQELHDRYLSMDVNAVIHPASPSAQAYARQQQQSAEKQDTVTQEQLSAEQYLERGYEKSQSGDKRGALDDYSKALDLNPRYVRAWYNRGVIKDVLGDRPGSIADYDEAIKLDPKHVSAHYNRALMKRHLGDNDGALIDYNKAIELDPKHADAHVGRGNVLDDQGDEAGAIRDYTRAIELDAENETAYNNRANVRNRQKDRQGALDDYNKAIEIRPNYATAFFNRGVVKDALEDKQGAIDDYTKAIQINPNYASPYINRGVIYYNDGDYHAAKRDWERAVEIDPNRANAKKNLGIVNKKLDGAS